MKKILIKTIITSMIIAIFSTSFFKNSTVASAAVYQDQSAINSSIAFEKNEKNTISARALPPRQPSKDPFWKWVTAVAAGFVGLKMAEIFVENAINNGIDYACKKWGKKPGIKQTCKIIN